MITQTIIIKAKDRETEEKVAATLWFMANPETAGRKWEATHNEKYTPDHSEKTE